MTETQPQWDAYEEKRYILALESREQRQRRRAVALATAGVIAAFLAGLFVFTFVR